MPWKGFEATRSRLVVPPALSALLSALLSTVWAGVIVIIVGANVALAQQAMRAPYVKEPVVNGVLPSRGIDPKSLASDAAAGITLPNWSGSFVAKGTTYNYVMLGTDPALGSATTTIHAILVPLKLEFADGTILDPSAPVYGQTQSSVVLTEQSPLFKPVPFTPGGTNVGDTEYIDAFQRADFWNYVSTSAPDYHILYKLTAKAVETLHVPAYFGYTKTGPGNRVGYVDNSWMDGQLAVLMYKLKIKTNTVPLFLVYDTFSYGSNFVFGGYHSAFGSPGQVYAEFGFYDNVLSPTTGDIMTLSHELAELTADPYIQNIVPNWSNPEFPGQCSDLLEVGDPVNAILLQPPVTLKGFTYHLEDLTFLPWFELQSPSSAVNGWYTFGNYYSSPATCSGAAPALAAAGRGK
ncbi:MAG: hypothetical protein ACLPN2_20210 [Terriglobales bacterium]